MGLQWLMSYNSLYADVCINSQWLESWTSNDDDDDDKSTSSDDTIDYVYNPDDQTNGDADSQQEDVEDDNEQDDNRLRGIPFDTCMQPDGETGYEGAIDNSTVSVAPAENQQPICMTTDEFFEEMAFPDKYPCGRGGYNSTTRPVRLTLRKFYNQRLLNCDGRFASDTDYLFSAQYAVERKQIADNISVYVRQIRGGDKIVAHQIKDPERLQSHIRSDNAYRCLSTIRGSPEYWRRTLLDVLAMVRQLGIPTWFMTLTSADLRWPEVIMSVAHQYGEQLTEEQVFNFRDSLSCC